MDRYDLSSHKTSEIGGMFNNERQNPVRASVHRNKNLQQQVSEILRRSKPNGRERNFDMAENTATVSNRISLVLLALLPFVFTDASSRAYFVSFVVVVMPHFSSAEKSVVGQLDSSFNPSFRYVSYLRQGLFKRGRNEV